MTCIAVWVLLCTAGAVSARGDDASVVVVSTFEVTDSLDVDAPLTQLLQALSGCCSSEVIELIGVPLTRSQLQQLCAVAELRTLHLQSCPLCSEKCAIIARSRELVELQLIDARLIDARLPALAPVTELKGLDLRGNPVSDDGLPALAAFSRLEWLDLRGTHVTSRGIRSLRALRPDLSILCDPVDPPPAEAVGQRIAENLCE